MDACDGVKAGLRFPTQIHTVMSKGRKKKSRAVGREE
jgi:hypothetical protein